MTDNRLLWRSVFKVGAATLLYYGAHSLLATEPAKQLVERKMGTRPRRALYRLGYNAQAIGGLIALYRYCRPLPDKTLYQVEETPKTLLRGAQALTLLAAGATVLRVGFGRFSGFGPLLAALRGASDIPQEAEGQGPGETPDGKLDMGGTFRVSRHPLNLAFGVLLWLNPRLTAKQLAFNAITSVYLYLGSIREAVRFRRRYPEQYSAFERSGVGFFFPRLRRK